MQLFDIGVIFRILDHPRDGAPLIGHPQPLLLYPVQNGFVHRPFPGLRKASLRAAQSCENRKSCQPQPFAPCQVKPKLLRPASAFRETQRTRGCVIKNIDSPPMMNRLPRSRCPPLAGCFWGVLLALVHCAPAAGHPRPESPEPLKRHIPLPARQGVFRLQQPRPVARALSISDTDPRQPGQGRPFLSLRGAS